jgi:hypothetical protein
MSLFRIKHQPCCVFYLDSYDSTNEINKQYSEQLMQIQSIDFTRDTTIIQTENTRMIPYMEQRLDFM